MDKMFKGLLPLVEGKLPPVTVLRKDGTLYSYYPKEDPLYHDEEIRETKNYEIYGKEEYYSYVTVCKECRCEFIAYLESKLVRKYCPYCGKRLE